MTTRVEQKTERCLSNLCGALEDPVICHRGNLNRPPEFMQYAITCQRLLENLAAVRENRTPLGTDAEVAWYVASASLEAPISSEWERIYAYCFTQTFRFLNKEIPPDLEFKGELDLQETYMLSDLRRWIYAKSSAPRLDAGKEKRKQQREEGVKVKVERIQEPMF